MKRPNQYDPEVIRAAVERLLPEAMEWLEDGAPPEEDRETVAQELARHIHASDGYEYARSMEYAEGWDPDSSLVEILDYAPQLLWLEERAAWAKWIAAYQVTPLRELGETITVEGHRGEIANIDRAHGTYSVFIEALGHVRTGQGTHARIYPWEQIDGKVNAGGLTVTGPLFQIECAL